MTDLLGCAAFVVEVVGNRFKYLSFNQKLEDTTGISHARVSGHFLEEIFPEGQVRHISANYQRCIEFGEPLVYDEQLSLPGAPHHWNTTLSPIRAPSGEIVRLLGTSIDITAERLAIRQLSASERQLRTIINSLPVGIAYVDRDLRLRFFNNRYLEWRPSELSRAHNARVDELLKSRFEEFKHPIELALSGQEVRFEREEKAHNSIHIVEAHYVPDKGEDGSVHGFFAMVQDITERKHQEQTLTAQAQRDGLTGLLNRRGLIEELDLAMQQATSSPNGLAVLFLDLDGFKQVNDTLGHAAGDHLLKAVADRLGSSVRKSDTLARIAGDEFVILLRDIEAPEEVSPIAHKLLAAASAPVRISDTEATVTTSIGAALYQGEDMSCHELLHQADQAMYQAKRLGKNRFMLSQPPSR